MWRAVQVSPITADNPTPRHNFYGMDMCIQAHWFVRMNPTTKYSSIDPCTSQFEMQFDMTSFFTFSSNAWYHVERVARDQTVEANKDPCNRQR